MVWFKKPIKVRCKTKEEVGRLVNWLRIDSGLSQINSQRYEITVVMAMQYWDDPEEVLYFEVAVPYYKYKKLREQFIERESFDEILQMQAVTEIVRQEDLL